MERIFESVFYIEPMKEVRESDSVYEYFSRHDLVENELAHTWLLLWLYRSERARKTAHKRHREHIIIVIIAPLTERIIILYRLIFLSADNGFLDMETINRPGPCVGRKTTRSRNSDRSTL